MSWSDCSISSSRTQVVVERSICVHGGWRWIHFCGEEGRRRGRGREVETGREGKRRLGEEGRGKEGRRRLRGGGEEKSRG